MNELTTIVKVEDDEPFTILGAVYLQQLVNHLEMQDHIKVRVIGYLVKDKIQYPQEVEVSFNSEAELMLYTLKYQTHDTLVTDIVKSVRFNQRKAQKESPVT